MKEIGLKIQFYYPEGDDKQFQKQVPWTDDECVLICLDYCRNMAGMNKKQVERLIQERMELMNPPPKLKSGEYNNKKVKSFTIIINAEKKQQNMPAIATVVNFGVSFLHLKVTEKTENPRADIRPNNKPNKRKQNRNRH